MKNQKVEYYKKILDDYIELNINIDNNLSVNIISQEVIFNNNTNKFSIIINTKNLNNKNIKKIFDSFFEIVYSLTQENGNDLLCNEFPIILSNEFDDSLNLNKEKEGSLLKLDSDKLPRRIKRKIMFKDTYIKDFKNGNNQHYLPVFFQKRYFNFKKNNYSEKIGFNVVKFIKNKDNSFYLNDRSAIISSANPRKSLNKLGTKDLLYYSKNNSFLDNQISKIEVTENIVLNKLDALINKNKFKLLDDTGCHIINNSVFANEIKNNLMFTMKTRSIKIMSQIESEFIKFIKDEKNDDIFNNKNNIESLGLKDPKPFLIKNILENFKNPKYSDIKKIYQLFIKKELINKKQIYKENQIIAIIPKDLQRDNFMLSDNVIFGIRKDHKLVCDYNINDKNIVGSVMLYNKEKLIYVGDKISTKALQNIKNKYNNCVLKNATDFIYSIDAEDLKENIIKMRYGNKNPYGLYGDKSENTILEKSFIRQIIQSNISSIIQRKILSNKKYEILHNKNREVENVIINYIERKDTNDKINKNMKEDIKKYKP